MNFYPHHIKDFNNSTRHLTRVERSVYRDAIEFYYDSESVLTDDINKLSRRLLCVSEEEKNALKTVLSEFFIKTDSGYFHERCDVEITKYRANTSAKAKAGKASAAQRKQNSTRVKQTLNIRTTDEQLSSNQEPVTSNQEEIKDIAFDDFYLIYPKKEKRTDAEKVWRKIDYETKLVIIADVKNRVQNHSGWIEKKFICNPQAYLNGKRWQDEITSIGQSLAPQNKAIQTQQGNISQLTQFIANRETSSCTALTQ